LLGHSAGLEPHDMVWSSRHPCSMRGANGALVPRLQAVASQATQPIPSRIGLSRCIRWMPLPELIEGDQQFYAGALNDNWHHRVGESGSIQQGLACLSERRDSACSSRGSRPTSRQSEVKLTTLERASGAGLSRPSFRRSGSARWPKDAAPLVRTRTRSWRGDRGVRRVFRRWWRRVLSCSARGHRTAEPRCGRAVRQEVERRIADA